MSAFVNCVECFDTTLLFSRMLTQLYEQLQLSGEAAVNEEEDDGEDRFYRCSRITDFVTSLREIADKAKKPLFLVRESFRLILQGEWKNLHHFFYFQAFDVADRLRSMDEALLPALLQLGSVV